MTRRNERRWCNLSSCRVGNLDHVVLEISSILAISQIVLAISGWLSHHPVGNLRLVISPSCWQSQQQPSLETSASSHCVGNRVSSLRVQRYLVQYSQIERARNLTKNKAKASKIPWFVFWEIPTTYKFSLVCSNDIENATNKKNLKEVHQAEGRTKVKPHPYLFIACLMDSSWSFCPSRNKKSKNNVRDQ